MVGDEYTQTSTRSNHDKFPENCSLKPPQKSFKALYARFLPVSLSYWFFHRWNKCRSELQHFPIRRLSLVLQFKSFCGWYSSLEEFHRKQTCMSGEPPNTRFSDDRCCHVQGMDLTETNSLKQICTTFNRLACSSPLGLVNNWG